MNIIRVPIRAPPHSLYLALGEYYQVAILPTGVKKPKHKPSVEGAVGDVATAIIAKLRNEIFTSLSGLNAGILRALEAFNDKPFQKRFGSRNLIFENEEKPLLRALPMIPYEVCEWSYKRSETNFLSNIIFQTTNKTKQKYRTRKKMSTFLQYIPSAYCFIFHKHTN